MEQPTVLVDNCILSGSYADPARWRHINVRHGNVALENPLLVYQGNKMDQEFIRVVAEIRAISDYAAQGGLSLFTYDELQFESWQALHTVGHNSTPLSAFQNVHFNEVQLPIDRCKLFSYCDFVENEKFEEFIEWLLSVDMDYLCRLLDLRHVFTEYERRCASTLNLFKYMCTESVFGRERARDAFHYWTAECNEIEYLLTVDKKLINAYNNAVKHKKLTTLCKVVSPSTLVEEYNIPLDHIVIPECDSIYTAIGQKLKS